MRNWEMLYQKQPLQMDAILLLVALLIHAPITMLQLKAPMKGTKDKPYKMIDNVDFIEQQIKKKKEKKIVLPPKVPDVKKVVKQIKKSIRRPPKPAPIPKPKRNALENLKMKAPKISKLNTDRLKKLPPPQVSKLKGKNTFKDKNKIAALPTKRSNIKLGGGGGSIKSSGRKSFSAGGAPKLKNKSNFQMAESALPAGIGGGDEGNIKIGGGPVIIVPTGKKSRGDANILSSKARFDGSKAFKGKGISSNPSGGSGPGLAIGRGSGGGSISTGGENRGSAPIVSSSKKISKGSFSSGASSSGGSSGSSTKLVSSRLPSVSSIRRKPKARKKPMFLITGPLKNRKVISRRLPKYPDWAKSRGIEAAVSLRFTVDPEGNVKENIFVERTSGYPRLDKVALRSLRRWKFAPLPLDKLEDQTGTITMNFSVR